MHAASETAFVIYIYVCVCVCVCVCVHHYAITKHPLIPHSTCTATSAPRRTRGGHPLLRRNKAREGRENPRGNRTRQSTRARSPFRKYSRAAEGRISANRRKLPPRGLAGWRRQIPFNPAAFYQTSNIRGRKCYFQEETRYAYFPWATDACHAFFNHPPFSKSPVSSREQFRRAFNFIRFLSFPMPPKRRMDNRCTDDEFSVIKYRTIDWARWRDVQRSTGLSNWFEVHGEVFGKAEERMEKTRPSELELKWDPISGAYELIIRPGGWISSTTSRQSFN